MATISTDQIKQIVGGLYLENLALQSENAELKAAAVPMLSPLADPPLRSVDEITGHKHQPIHAVDNAG